MGGRYFFAGHPQHIVNRLRPVYTQVLMKACALLLFLATATWAAAQSPGDDLRSVGPQIGTKVPAFTLPDQAGQPRTLASLMGPKGAILVFFRSADW
jgi:cytochrome oxidase Cu insertion factor (SCO1/SenC/PrrC family)